MTERDRSSIAREISQFVKAYLLHMVAAGEYNREVLITCWYLAVLDLELVLSNTVNSRTPHTLRAFSGDKVL